MKNKTSIILYNKIFIYFGFIVSFNIRVVVDCECCIFMDDDDVVVDDGGGGGGGGGFA